MYGDKWRKKQYWDIVGKPAVSLRRCWHLKACDDSPALCHTEHLLMSINFLWHYNSSCSMPQCDHITSPWNLQGRWKTVRPTRRRFQGGKEHKVAAQAGKPVFSHQLLQSEDFNVLCKLRFKWSNSSFLMSSSLGLHLHIIRTVTSS